MIPAAFHENVQDALAYLYDTAHLATHPLARFLSPDGIPLPPDRLHRALRQTVAQLQPPPDTPVTSLAWRRYRYLELRYLNGKSHQAVALELSLSLRQAHRVRTAALDIVAARLWERYRGNPLPTSEPPPVQQIPSRPTRPPSLDDELERVVKSAADAPSSLSEEVPRAVEVVHPLADRRGILLDIGIFASGPSTAVGRAVLRQMIILLLSYALERPLVGRVSLSSQSVDEEVVLDIVALGSEGTLDEISPESDPRLHAVRRLAEAQQGALELLAATGGICLRLRLPSDRTYTVLIVDDNPDFARLLESYLQNSRYRMIHAKTARNALRLAEEARPDVISLDVMMPFQDGWEIFRHLRSNPMTKAIPILVCSILPEKEVALALGADDFLTKPVTAQSLVATLDRCRQLRSAVSRGSPSDKP